MKKIKKQRDSLLAWKSFVKSRSRSKALLMFFCVSMIGGVGIGKCSGQQTTGKLLKGEITNSVGMELQLILGGRFLMGSPSNETGREDEEVQHQAAITKDFYLGRHEVTQKQWKSVMGTEPWKGEEFVKEGGDIAASFMTHKDAIEFCRRLSKKEGVNYRLPTEAEWEFACRGGTRTAYSFGGNRKELKHYACCQTTYMNMDAKMYAQEVGQKRPNPLGLYDMHGNVWEWCQDWYGEDYYDSAPLKDPQGPASGTYKVRRGGSFYGYHADNRSAKRSCITPDQGDAIIGLRVLRTIDQ